MVCVTASSCRRPGPDVTLRSPLVLLAVPFVELFQYAYFAVCFDQQFPASLRFRREQDRLLGKLLVARFQ